MKKFIPIILIMGLLSGCLFRTHKIEVVQGNVINNEEVSQLHRGMSEDQVTSVLGTPLLVNLFAPGRVDYIYTYQAPHQPRQDQKLTLIFRGGRLQEIIRS